MKSFKFIYSSTYFILLSYLVFFARRRRNHHYNYEINFIPIKYSIKTFLTMNVNDKFEIFNFYLNLFGNIILFIPFAIILNTVFKVDKLKLILLFTVLLSTSIEILQYIFQVGLADIDDVILNSIGAILGYFIYNKIIQMKFTTDRKELRLKKSNI